MVKTLLKIVWAQPLAVLSGCGQTVQHHLYKISVILSGGYFQFYQFCGLSQQHPSCLRSKAGAEISHSFWKVQNWIYFPALTFSFCFSRVTLSLEFSFLSQLSDIFLHWMRCQFSGIPAAGIQVFGQALVSVIILCSWAGGIAGGRHTFQLTASAEIKSSIPWLVFERSLGSVMKEAL